MEQPAQDYPIIEFEFGNIEIRGSNGFLRVQLPGSNNVLQASFTVNLEKMSRTFQNFKEAIRAFSIPRETKQRIVATAQDKLTDYFLNAPKSNLGQSKAMVNKAAEDETTALKVFDLLSPGNEMELDGCEKISHYFFDIVGNAYAWVKYSDLDKTYYRSIDLNSRDFENFAALLYYQQFQKVANKEAIRSAIGLVRATVSHQPDIEFIPLNIRYARTRDAIVIDSGSPDYRIWEIKPDPAGNGIQECYQEEPLFKRFQTMREMARPNLHSEGKESLEKLTKFFHLKDEQDAILLSGFTGASMVADIPHPLFNTYGPKGATKTSLQKAFKLLLDPSAALTVHMTHSLNELVQTLYHNYVTVFENISRISSSQFDILCSASTGESDTKRALYENDTDFAYPEFFHVPFLNGINDLARRPDASERCLRIELNRVPTEKRLTKKQVVIEIERLIPDALGATFHALSKALYILPTVEKELQGKLPRMADFAIWGEAFCRALGYRKDEFFERYAKNVNISSFAALENNPIVDLIADLLGEIEKGKPLTWEGTCTKLLEEMKRIDKAIHDSRYSKDKQIPKSATKLSSEINELEEDMKALGYRIERTRGSDKKAERIIKISFTPSRDTTELPSDASERQKPQNQAQKKLDSSDATSDDPNSNASGHASENQGENQAQKQPIGRSDASDANSPKILEKRGELIFSRIDKGREGVYVTCREHSEGRFRSPHEWNDHVSAYHSE